MALDIQTIDYDPAADLVARIADLQKAMEEKLPGFKDQLRTIHKMLKDHDVADLKHMLTDEQVGVIVRGLSQHTGVVIAESKVAKGGKGKRLTSIEDLL